MTTWVKIFDHSFQRVPAKNYPLMYADGYRVMAGYVAGGTSDKWITAAEIRAWLATGPDTGFLPLFEAVGTEPATSPTSGTAHARAARAGARARGVADTSAISPAMDRDVTMTQAKGPIATYMREWKAADALSPLPYIELDAGAYLHTAGLSVGTGTPAAFDWDPDQRLITPANAPAHVLWTQEHNGVSLHGGSVDIGHVRTDAPIHWSDDMATADDVWGADLIPNGGGDAATNPTTKASFALGDIRTRAIASTAADAAIMASLAALTAKLGGITPAAIAAAVVAALPKGTATALTEADVETAVHAGLGKLGLTVAP